MVKKRKAFPEEGEFVIGTITKISSHGAYATLDEFIGKEGLIHISEIASTWVRNIRNYVREKQKVVAKVLRVDEAKDHIDLSLRRVTNVMRRNKIQEWKRSQKADKLLELVAKQLEKTKEEAYDAVGWPLEKKFGEIYAGFEEVNEKGEKALEKAGIGKEWIKTVTELAKAHVTIRKVKLTTTVELQSFKANGIEIIKDALKKGLKSTKRKDVALDVNLIGSPRYRFSVQANDYKIAEKILNKAINTTITALEKGGGEGRLEEND
ncbi:MAG: translation initiation factor IF-2 subunit alpha [Promethearchaeota archaeon]